MIKILIQGAQGGGPPEADAGLSWRV